jgi:hypothetical protein
MEFNNAETTRRAVQLSLRSIRQFLLGSKALQNNWIRARVSPFSSSLGDFDVDLSQSSDDLFCTVVVLSIVATPEVLVTDRRIRGFIRIRSLT